MKKIEMIMAAVLALLFAASGFGQGKDMLTKGTDAINAWLENRGISLESSYKGELWANVRGGIKQSQTHLHNIDIAAELGTRQAGLWGNGKFFVHILSNFGGRLLTEKIIGDSQTVSNIEAPHSTRLYELWYEHSFFDKKLSFLAGIHDLNSEFAVTEHGALFLNSSFGISKEISGGGRPGVFPLAAPAIRARYAPDSAWEFKLGVYNGDPGDPCVYRNFPRLDFDSKGGAFIVLESAYHYGSESSPGAVKAGYWRNTGMFEDLLKVDIEGNPVSHKRNEGFYLIADKMIFMNGDNQGLGAFLQLGLAPNGKINEFQSYIGGGLKYMGLLPHRKADEIGIAVAHARVGNKLVKYSGREMFETTLEATYRMIVNKRIVVQPDVQLIINPGAEVNIKNAIVVGARFEVMF
jgi:porin